jgi:glycosyltransferase involved in cell wall biosynthesis
LVLFGLFSIYIPCENETMTVPNYAVTLIIPILNEAESLPKLLLAIESQIHRPDEIIFVDAGSTDDGVNLIQNWWGRVAWAQADCKVLSKPGAMPGAGRNAGVQAARNDWIAFIDGGIEPSADWLENLCQHASVNESVGVFGQCHFSATQPFGKAICALSYGHGSIHPVIPASLFQRKVFDEIGGFPEHLRAGEDLIWMSVFQVHYGNQEVCESAVVYYSDFPVRWTQALRKWFVTESHCVLAKVRTRQHVIYLFGLPAIYSIAWVGDYHGTFLLLSYLILRGVVDPIRRSKHNPWWGSKMSAAFIAAPLAIALDLAKWAGIIHGFYKYFLNQWKLGRSRVTDF